MATIVEAVQGMVGLRDSLVVLGFSDETVAEAIRLGGDAIPVFGSQLTGCYIRQDGRRDAHSAVPGWYRFVSVEGNSVTIIKDHPNAEPFHFYGPHLRFCLAPNLECVAKGLQP